MSGLETALMGMGTSASGTGLMAGSAAAASPAAAGAAMQPLTNAGALGAGIGSQKLAGGVLGPLMNSGTPSRSASSASTLTISREVRGPQLVARPVSS